MNIFLEVFDMDKKGTLYAGFGRAIMTPSEPKALCGYPEPDRIFNEVGDDIYTSCTALRDSEGTTVLLFSIDFLLLSTGLCDMVRKGLEEELGVKRDHILLNATHAHASCAPTEALLDHCVEAAKEAIADLSECEVYTAIRETMNFAFCRRFLTKDGKLFTYQDRPMIFSFEEKPDENAYLIKFAREDKKDIVLANFAAHNDTTYGCDGKRLTLSADYVGAIRKHFEKNNDAFLSFHMGAAGDLNPVNTPYPFYSFPGTDRYGRLLAREFTEGLREAKKLDGDKTVRSTKVIFEAEVDHSRDEDLETSKKIYSLFYDENKQAEAIALAQEHGFVSGVLEAGAIIDKAAMPKFETMELSVISVGDLAFAVVPYEMFNHTGIQVREHSKFDTTFICAYSNGFHRYIPTLVGFSHGGYEMVTCIYKPGTAEESVEKYRKLLDELYE